MRRKTNGAAGVAGGLAEGRRRFDEFRRKHRARCPLPESLWRAAVDLAGEHGVSRTAQALGLDYYSLKSRLEEMPPRAERRPASGPPGEFIEVVPWRGACDWQCTIELEEGGAKMRIRLRGGTVPDLAAITGGFRRGEPCSR